MKCQKRKEKKLSKELKKVVNNIFVNHFKEIHAPWMKVESFNSENVQVHSYIQRVQSSGRVCRQTSLLPAQCARGNPKVLAKSGGATFGCKSHTRFAKGKHFFNHLSIIIIYSYVLFISSANFS